jgi:hypothetical protein
MAVIVGHKVCAKFVKWNEQVESTHKDSLMKKDKCVLREDVRV